DYRAMRADFLTDENAGAIRFDYDPSDKSPVFFKLSDRALTPETPAGSDMRLPRIQAPGYPAFGWVDTGQPYLGDTPLDLNKGEVSHSLAIAPDGERFLLGTSSYIHLFDREGHEVWSLPAPEIAWGVNISGDGRVALAAYADGTIHWYRMADGKELLAFFPHKDHKRWVLWTPSGYYDASPGAEDFIGWHVNNGHEAADFFPIGKFRAVYYRPDVVAKMLEKRDEQLALREANEQAGRKQQQADITGLLPPVVEITSPADGAELATNEFVVHLRLRTPSGEAVTEVRALVDGRPITAERGLMLQAAGQSGSERELRVTAPAGEREVSVIASNRYAASVPATVRVHIRPAVGVGSSVGPASEQFEIRPKLYVL